MKFQASRTLILFPVLLLSLTACSSSSPNANDSSTSLSASAIESKEKFNTLLDSFIEEPNVVNTMLSVSNGKPQGTYSIEKGEAEPGIPMSDGHQFHIASMTKPFTATIMLQLVEEGYFALDTTLADVFGNMTMAEYFPEYTFTRSNTNSIAVADMKVEQLQMFGGLPQGEQITIQQLLQHSHGMPDVTFDAPIGAESLAGNTVLKFAGLVQLDPAQFPDQWSGPALLEYYLASGLPLQSLYPPGEDYHYGDTGPVIAGLIIENVTGMSLADAYRMRIFDPLGMDDTYLHHYEEPRLSRSAGISHRQFDLTGLLADTANIDVDAANWNTSIDWAGGGLVSTAGDIERFHRGLFEGELLNNPAVIGSAENRVDGDEETSVYGLGFGLQLSTDRNTVVSYEHGGFWGSYMMYIPESKTSVSFTANQVEFDRFEEFMSLARTLH